MKVIEINAELYSVLGAIYKGERSNTEASFLGDLLHLVTNEGGEKFITSNKYTLKSYVNGQRKIYSQIKRILPYLNSEPLFNLLNEATELQQQALADAFNIKYDEDIKPFLEEIKYQNCPDRLTASNVSEIIAEYFILVLKNEAKKANKRSKSSKYNDKRIQTQKKYDIEDDVLSQFKNELKPLYKQIEQTIPFVVNREFIDQVSYFVDKWEHEEVSFCHLAEYEKIMTILRDLHVYSCNTAMCSTYLPDQDRLYFKGENKEQYDIMKDTILDIRENVLSLFMSTSLKESKK